MLPLEELLKQLLEGQKELAEGQAQIIQRLDRLETTVNEINKTVGGSQKDIATLLERSATKESITSLDSKFNLLNNRLFETENKINLLSLVK